MRYSIQWAFAFSLVFLFTYSCSESESKTLFEAIPPSKSGIEFRNTVRESEEFNVMNYGYFYNGGGVAIGDLNNDGLDDIYFTGNMKASHLYLNKGDFQFDEIAKKAGVMAEGLWNTGVTMADVNNDGWLDIYVCRSAAALDVRRKNLLFINNHDMTFTESASEYGLDDMGYSTQAVFFDYDKDDDLDMFLINHSTQDYAGFSNQLKSFKTRESKQFGDKLYRNDLIKADGASFGRFTDVTARSGIISNVLGFGLGVAVEDLDGDGWLDIYVSNDYNEEDYCYINQQDGTFKESVRELFDQTSLFSMGSDVADINNDGLPEVYTLDMLPESNFRQKMSTGSDNYDKKQSLYKAGFHYQSMRNMLHLNNGNGTYSEIGQLSGISNSDWSWSALFADFDLDGWKDLFVSNGYKSDYTNMEFISFAVNKIGSSGQGENVNVSALLSEIPPISVSNYIYKNQGNLLFSDETTSWGLDGESLSNGAAYADLDNDGDLDLIINNVNEYASVYRNNAQEKTGNHFIKIKLESEEVNTFGIGAKVNVKSTNISQVQTMMLSRGFQSSVSPVLTFGLGSDSIVSKIEITWPNGNMQEVTSPNVDELLTIPYNPDSAIVKNVKIPSSSLFKDISSEVGLNHVHVENTYNDYKREPLLLHQYSAMGPCIAVGDVDGDGSDDVFIGGARGSSGHLYLQDKFGNFTKTVSANIPVQEDGEDVDALFVDVDNDADLDLYVVNGGSEGLEGGAEYKDRLYVNDGSGVFNYQSTRLPDLMTNSSRVTAGDVDNDGDQDLFIGGGHVPGEYPTKSSSALLINDGTGHFTRSINPYLDSLGIVTDALWVDLNGDSYDDLIVVGEFMPITIFLNDAGSLSPVLNAAQDEASYGWWNVIKGADFDKDGDTDFIVGNYGLNNQLRASPEEPIEIFAKDFDNNGSMDPIVTSYSDGKSYPIVYRDDFLAQLTGFSKKFDNYEKYASASFSEFFTKEELKGAIHMKVNNLATAYIRNEGGGSFSFHKLPLAAQTSPIYAITIEDFNNDSNLDILLSGNKSDSRVQLGRSSANKGVVLLGNGSGEFEYLESSATGISVKGNVRESELIELSDGRNVILIAKNDSETQVIEVLKK